MPFWADLAVLVAILVAATLSPLWTERLRKDGYDKPQPDDL